MIRSLRLISANLLQVNNIFYEQLNYVDAFFVLLRTSCDCDGEGDLEIESSQQRCHEWLQKTWSD